MLTPCHFISQKTWSPGSHGTYADHWSVARQVGKGWPFICAHLHYGCPCIEPVFMLTRPGVCSTISWALHSSSQTGPQKSALSVLLSWVCPSLLNLTHVWKCYDLSLPSNRSWPHLASFHTPPIPWGCFHPTFNHLQKGKPQLEIPYFFISDFSISYRSQTNRKHDSRGKKEPVGGVGMRSRAWG